MIETYLVGKHGRTDTDGVMWQHRESGAGPGFAELTNLIDDSRARVRVVGLPTRAETDSGFS